MPASNLKQETQETDCSSEFKLLFKGFWRRTAPNLGFELVADPIVPNLAMVSPCWKAAESAQFTVEIENLLVSRSYSDGSWDRKLTHRD